MQPICPQPQQGESTIQRIGPVPVEKTGTSYLKSAGRAVNHVALSLLSFSRLEDLLQDALDRALEVMETEAGAVHLLDEHAHELRLVAQTGLPQSVAADADRYRLGEGLPGWVAQTGEPVVVDDLTSDSRVTRRMARAEGYRGFAAVPLKTHLKTYGAIQVVTHARRTFSQEEVDILRAIGTQIGLGIENGRLILELRLKMETESLLRRVSSALNAHSRVEESFPFVIDSVGRALNARRSLMHLNTWARALRLPYEYAEADAKKNAPAIRALIRELESQMGGHASVLVLEDLTIAPVSAATRAKLEKQRAGSFLVAPLMCDRRIAGLLLVEAQRVRQWQSAEVTLVETVANQMALALDRIRLEKNLRASERQFRDLVETARDLIFQVDRHGRIVYANPVVRSLLQLKPEEIRSAKPWAFEFVHPDDREPLREHFTRILRGQATEHHINYRVASHDGPTVRWVSQNSSLLRAPGGRARVVQAFARDVTEDRRLQREMLEANRLADLGRLAAAVAHEIRNPLGTIVSCIELLQQDVGTQSDPRLVKVATEEAAHLNDILSDLLTFAKPGEREEEQFALEEVIDDTLRLFRHSARGKPGVEIAFESCSALPPVRGDRQQIRQVVWNLLVNALDAVGVSGRIAVALEKVQDATHTSVVVRVQDTGPGIPARVLDQIFQPFFTTKASGSGLGLAIVDRLVREHGGTVTVEQPDGEGTTFSVRLPAVM
ncbi:MAG TPA: ATP-binding protein [Vicinamibacterales bacterium]|nr:ATP-binding protein [Vicinamibacterales bacterium]